MKRRLVPRVRAGVLFLAAYALFFFSNGRWSTPVAPWFASGLILIGTRRMRPVRGYLLNSLLLGLCLQLSFLHFSSKNPASPLFYLPFFLGFAMALPYTADRLCFGRFRGVAASLVFPASYAVFEYAYVTLSPFGGTGAIAYTQVGFLPLVQLAAFAGIHGIAFLVAWTAPILASIATAFATARPVERAPVAAYGIVLAVVLILGQARLLAGWEGRTVRVSGVTAYELRSADVDRVWDSVREDPEAFRRMSAAIVESLERATRREAEAGSKIVVWAEVSPPLLARDEAAFRVRLAALAREAGIYLVASPWIVCGEGELDLAEAWIVDPEGEIVLEHAKYGGAAFDGIVAGDGSIRSVETPYGRVAAAVCWDTDFAAPFRGRGREGLDMLLSPAADWKEIVPLHSATAYFRGLETGASVVRQTVSGRSFASDSKGRIVASMDHDRSADRTLVAQVPVARSFAPYAFLGDLPMAVVVLAAGLGLLLQERGSGKRNNE